MTISPHFCMTHDNTLAVSEKFLSIASKIRDPRQLVMCLDHDIQNVSPANLQKYKQIEEFAKQHGADFYPVSIAHAV